MTGPKSLHVQLTGRLQLASEVFHLSFERTGNHPVVFRPGQYICLRKDLDGDMATGYYSLASAPRPDGFELCVRVTETGSKFGRFLTQCKLGNGFDIESPTGNFLLREPLRTSVFAVHGTGIAPVRSMLQFLLLQEQNVPSNIVLTLLQGARTSGDLYYRREFEVFEQQYSQFRFWPILSRAGAEWAGRTGHAQEYILEALGCASDYSDVYLCGCRAMVETTTENLVRQGFDEQTIIHEKYG